MLKNFIISIITTLYLCVVFQTPAHAETVNVDVRANRTTEVYNLIVYLPGLCRSMARPVFKARQVKHGKLDARPGTAVIQEGDCKGRRMNSTTVYYTPERGFRGKDTAKLSFRMDKYYKGSGGFRFVTVNLNITVK